MTAEWGVHAPFCGHYVIGNYDFLLHKTLRRAGQKIKVKTNAKAEKESI